MLTEQLPYENPFAAGRIIPGSLPFFFPDGCNWDCFLDRLRRFGYRGQVLGPHGVGKSTLLFHLTERLQQLGLRSRLLAFREGYALPAVAILENCSRTDVLLVDGFEQLNFVHRLLLVLTSRIVGSGLVVATHRRQFLLPVLLSLEPNEKIALQVAEKLQEGYRPLVSREDILRCYRVAGGNVREAIFALHDLYDKRRKQQVT